MKLQEIMASLFSRRFFSTYLTLRGILSPVALGALALAEHRGKIVLVRQSYTSGWHLPGGGVERGEPPATAVMRELREEIGLTNSAPPELFGIYTRKLGLATNVNVLYRVRDAQFDFKPTLEIRDIMLADPAAPPPDAASGVRRRLAELTGQMPQSPSW
jgi:8-oxo-dGTP pyrophosphatase MutT (NUDIX family)